MKLLKWLKFKMPKKYDRFIHLSVIVLMTLGTLMIISTSVGETYSSKTIVIKTIIKQMVFVTFAYFCMVNVANRFVFEKVMKYQRAIGIVILLLLAACLMSHGANGAKSWIYITIPFFGQISIQPSEFFKVYIVVCMACIIEKVKRRNIEWWAIVREPISFYGIAAIIILFQHDLGSLIVISLICAICFLIPSHPNLRKIQKYASYGLGIGTLGVVFLSSNLGIALLEKLPFFQTYMINRFKMAANPWTDEYNAGLQLINSLYAFASGGWNGLGLGQSIQKMQYLPEALTDYILAITVEELGIIGFILVMVCYGAIIYSLFKYALMSKREGYKIVYIGTALYLFIHFVFNVGGVTGLIPLTGIPLLFISSGASSLVSICTGLGICQALAARENRERLDV